MTIVLMKYKPTENPDAFPYHAFMVTPTGLDALAYEFNIQRDGGIVLYDDTFEQQLIRQNIRKIVKSLYDVVSLDFGAPNFDRIDQKELRRIESKLRQICNDDSISLEMLSVLG